MTERREKILEILAKAHKVEVSEFANLLQVSQVTIRKDLDQLEAAGLLRREHGFAVFGSADDVGRRLAVQYDVKRRIAQRAANLVSDGETVMMESGSCCAILAEELAKNKKNVTIITNSTFLINHVRHINGCKLILLGGEYLADAQAVTGAITRKGAELFFEYKFFMGADGFSDSFGFTARNHSMARAIQDIAEQAGQIIVLTESDKFTYTGVEGTVRMKDISVVITDDHIPQTKEDLLVKHNVKVMKVQA